MRSYLRPPWRPRRPPQGRFLARMPRAGVGDRPGRRIGRRQASTGAPSPGGAQADRRHPRPHPDRRPGAAPDHRPLAGPAEPLLRPSAPASPTRSPPLSGWPGRRPMRERGADSPSLAHRLMKLCDKNVSYLRGAVAARTRSATFCSTRPRRTASSTRPIAGCAGRSRRQGPRSRRWARVCTRRTGWRWSRRAGRCRRRRSLARCRPRGYPGRVSEHQVPVARAVPRGRPSLFQPQVCLVGRRPRGYPGTGQMELHTSGHLARGGLFLARRAVTHLA